MPTINEDKKALPASPPQSPPKKRKAASKDDLEAQAAKKAKNEQVNKAEFLDAVFDHARKSGTEYLMNRFGLDKATVNNWINPGRANLRSRAVKAAQESKI